MKNIRRKITIMLDPHLVEQVKAMTRLQGISMAALIEALLRAWVFGSIEVEVEPRKPGRKPRSNG